MLQQTPEYKRLPLHRIHSRRLSTKDFDYSAPNTGSHVSTKTESNASLLANATLAHSTTHHGGMYCDEPKNDHQPFNATPVELATTLWPPHATNYWFPNWKELFHGFLVVQKGQPSQAFVADFEQRQSLRPGSNNAITSIPSQQPTSSALPSWEQHHLQAYTKYTTQSHHPIPIPSCDVVHSPALSKRKQIDQAQIGDAKKASSSPSQATHGAITKCSIKSPLWLPQGWITEQHIRRTGTTAGAQDKYFKHVQSGRRFRSRMDVLHFASTGKGRTRKQTRGKNGLMLSAGHSLVKRFAHQKLSILQSLKPFSRSCLENKYSTHVADLMLRGHSEPRLKNEFGPPCKQSNSLCSSSSIQSPGKASAKERAQKLPIKKKDKTLPSKIGEDKQGSKLWQWLTNPVASDSSIPLNQEVLTLSLSSPGVEKKAIEMTDPRSVKVLTLRDKTNQRTIQLSKELQVAHENVVQKSREMQATAEKLSREILVAQKDVELGHEIQVSKVQAGTCVVLADNSGNRYGSETDAISRSYVTTPIVHHSSCKAIFTADDLPKTAQIPKFASCSVVPRPNDTFGILNEQHLMLRDATGACSIPSPVNQPTTWPNMVMNPEVSIATRAHTAMENGREAPKSHKDTFNHVIQPALVGTVPKHAVAAVHVPQQTELCNVTKGDVTWRELPMVHTQSPLQMAAYVSSGGITNTAEKRVSLYSDMTQPVNEITDGTCIARSCILATNDYSKQPDVVTEANDAQATRRHTRSMDHLAVVSKEQANPSHGICADAKGNAVVAGEAGILKYGTQLSSPCSGLEIDMQETNCRDRMRRQLLEEVQARHLRRKKFSAVLNPKLDLSRISPSLTTRQRAKVVERMKARHARELLANLGKHICSNAVRRKQ